MSKNGDNTRPNEPPGAATVPEDIQQYLILRGRLLDEEFQKCRAIQRERRRLLYLAREYEIQELEWATEESDPASAVSMARSFCLTGSDVPFFSESELYELVGKEDARTVLAIVDQLIDQVVVSG